MANGIYAAAAGMAAQQTRIDAISNDLANSDTTGYKAEQIGFADLLSNSDDGVAVGAGARAIDLGPSMSQGTLAASDNPIAVGINGPGFLQTRSASGGTTLTRDGDLQIDAAHSLVTSDGSQLVPPITLPAGATASDLTISPSGTVSVNGKTVGQIQLVNVASPGGLQAAGASSYVTTAASGGATPATGSTLEQGKLEQSNVDMAQTMTSMLDAQNNYSLLSHVLSTQDQLLQMANQLRST
jgi:flagellar basal-body rod protein FlgG